MTELHPCPGCAELVLEGTCVCPHCGAKACHRSGVHGKAVLLGLTLVMGAGCPSQPDYGVIATTTSTADTGDTGTATSASTPREDR